MKKIVATVLLIALLATPVTTWAVKYEKSPLVAMILSMTMPGSGEWYNGDWKTPFPWAECILGICPCVMFSSVFDAINGNTDTNLRIDFWTAPAK
jgi:hypothetical protein